MLKPRYNLCSPNANDDSNDPTCKRKQHGFEQELKQNRTSAGSDGPADANFLAALRNADQRNAHDHDPADACCKDRHDKQKLTNR